MLTLEDLKSKGLIPKDAQLLNVPVDKQFNISLFKDKDSLDLENQIPVIENVKWIAYSSSADLYFSGNDDQVGRYSPSTKSMSIKIVKTVNGKEKFKTLKNYTLIKGEESIMAKKDVNTNPGIFPEVGGQIPDLPDLNADDLGAGLGGELDPMKVFNDAPAAEEEEKEAKKELTPEEQAERERKKQERDAKKKAAQAQHDAITAGVENDSIANVDELAAFNRSFGAIYGSITANDALVKFGLSTEYLKDDKDAPKWNPDTPEDKKDEYTKTKDKGILAQYCAKQTHLTARQVAPGKILGWAIGIPVGGLFSIEELKKDVAVHPDTTKKDVVIQLMNVDEAIDCVGDLFDCRIPEFKGTYGEYASTVYVGQRTYTKKDENKVPISMQKFVLKVEGRTNMVCPNAYFPLKTYETVTLDGDLTEEQSQELAKSSFYHLFNPTARNNANTSGEKAIDNLALDEAVHASEKDGVYSSDFFTPSAAARKVLQISGYYQKKGQYLDVVEIPVKEDVNANKPDKTKVRMLYKSYSVFDADKNEQAKVNNPLALAKANSKFSIFFNAVGGEELINLTNLKKFKSSRSNTNKEEEFDSTTIRKLLAARRSGRTEVGQVSFDKSTKNSGASLNKMLASLKVKYAIEAADKKEEEVAK